MVTAHRNRNSQTPKPPHRDGYPESVPPAISTRDLHVTYGESTALSNVTLDLPTGSSLAVIGPNGSGKSTLLGALAGTIEPSSGSVTIAGRPPALVLQATEVDRSLPITVEETVALSRYPSLGLLGRFRATDRKAIADALRRLEIDDLAGTQLHELSGGQRQRLSLARAILKDPDILILDEATSQIDIESETLIHKTLATFIKDRTTLIITHRVSTLELVDYIMLMNEGEVIDFGTHEQLMSRCVEYRKIRNLEFQEAA